MALNNLNNQDIIMKDIREPSAINAANYKPNVIITMMKKEMKFNLDPNIQDNLAQYISENNTYFLNLKIKNK